MNALFCFATKIDILFIGIKLFMSKTLKFVVFPYKFIYFNIFSNCNIPMLAVREIFSSRRVPV